MPSVPTPAYEIAATVVSRYVATRMSVAATAARPGVFSRSFVSSFKDRIVSQPQ